ncbi:hypothetical protein NQZ68_016659 [Dissostichus eleginoides]|nr:hypothetical protein NQZ68_016659 [Dissostichus eleginoides]
MDCRGVLRETTHALVRHPGKAISPRKIRSRVESLYSSKSDTLSSGENPDCHKEMLDSLSGTRLSCLALL